MSTIAPPAGQIVKIGDSQWYVETNSQWPGQAMAIEIEEKLLDEKSQYQHIQVYKTKTFGNMLVLDGVIQLTERDEMAYQEMIAHLPLFAHKDPKSVLIVGGGDGGVIREVVKHSGVEKIVICEIDKVVIEAGKKYFPTVAAAWDDPRVELVCGDASQYIAKPEVEGTFDVIISDTSDPVGPAQALFESPFYQAMHKALKPGGKCCTQAESIWMHLDLIARLVKDSAAIFDNVEYASTQIPTYPCGQIGLLVCSKGKPRERKVPTAATPARNIPKGDADKFRFYTTALHEASFIMPAFVQKRIDESLEAAAEYKKSQEEPKSATKGRKRKSTDADEEGEKRAKVDDEAADE